MRLTTFEEEKEISDFAKQAARAFKHNSDLEYFGTLKKGNLFAMRWGIMEDCVLVIKLDSDFEPVNFQNIVERN